RRDRQRGRRPPRRGHHRAGRERRGRADRRAVHAAGIGTPPGRRRGGAVSPTLNRPDLLIRGGGVVDAESDRVADVRVSGGRVVAVGSGLDGADATTIDASGCLVAPGLVDLHTHLRQPGKEEAETIESGSRAAALGGYTAVL